MDRDEKSGLSTLTGVAIAIVALSRFIGATHPELAPFLKKALTSAEAAGLPPNDLMLLRTIIASIGITSGGRGNPESPTSLAVAAITSKSVAIFSKLLVFSVEVSHDKQVAKNSSAHFYKLGKPHKLLRMNVHNFASALPRGNESIQST